MGKEIVDVPSVSSGFCEMSANPGFNVLPGASGVDIQTGGEEKTSQCTNADGGLLLQEE